MSPERTDTTASTPGRGNISRWSLEHPYIITADQPSLVVEDPMKSYVGLAGGLAVLALTAAGCATAPGAHARWHTGWDKPGMTGEAFELDVRACDREANRVVAAEPGHSSVATPGGARATGPSSMAPLRQSEHEKAYTDCMKTKGYTATKSN